MQLQRRNQSSPRFTRRITSRGAAIAIAAAAVSYSTVPTRADFLYTGYRNSSITRVDERTGNIVGVFAEEVNDLSSFRDMVLGPDGLLYVSALHTFRDQFGRWGVYRINPSTGEFLGSVVDDIVDRIAFGPNGNLYGVDSWGTDELIEFDPLTGEQKRVILTTPNSYWGIGNFAFVDERHLFIVTDASKIARYDVETGNLAGPITDLHDLGFGNFRFDEVTLSPSGEVLAAYNYRGRDTELPGGVLRFDATTGQLVDSLLNNLPAFGAASGGQLGLAFGPDGDLYVGSPRAKAVLRFDVASHAKIGEYFTPGPSHSAEFIVFLPVNVPEPATIVLALFSASCLLIAQPRRRMNALR